MDISSNITSLFNLTRMTVNYLQKVEKRNNKEQHNVLKEIIATNDILIRLKIKSNVHQWKDMMNALNMSEGPFGELRVLLKGINDKLEPTKTLFQYLKWPFGKIEIMTILFTIKQIQSCFNLGLQNDHLYDYLNCLFSS